MKSVPAFLLLFFLSGCTAIPLSPTFTGDITAVPKSAQFSGWILNHCYDSEPILLENLSCPQIGGEIHIVKVSFPKKPGNERIANFNKVLVIQHALRIPDYNQSRWCFNIEPAPLNIAKSTGVKYIAREYFWNCANEKA